MGRSEDLALAVPKLRMFELHADNNTELLPDLSKVMDPLPKFIGEGLRDRLEIKIVRQEIVAAKAGKKLAKGNILPNGQISFGYDRQVNFAPEPNLNKMYVMGSFPLPVFDVQQGELARISATLKQLDLEMLSQQNVIRGQIALAYRKVFNAREISANIRTPFSHNLRRFQGLEH